MSRGRGEMGGQGQVPGADIPLGGLPTTQRVLLHSAPIEVALIEVRYTTGRESVTTDEGLKLRELVEQVGVQLPRLQPIQQQQLALNFTTSGANSQVEIRSSGWQL